MPTEPDVRACVTPRLDTAFATSGRRKPRAVIIDAGLATAEHGWHGWHGWEDGRPVAGDKTLPRTSSERPQHHQRHIVARHRVADEGPDGRQDAGPDRVWSHAAGVARAVP